MNRRDKKFSGSIFKFVYSAETNEIMYISKHLKKMYRFDLNVRVLHESNFTSALYCRNRTIKDFFPELRKSIKFILDEIDSFN